MNDEQQPMTFLDKVEHTFEELRNELINLFTDQAAIHNLTSDAKMKVISHAADHFGEPNNEINVLNVVTNKALELQKVHDELKEEYSQLQKDYDIVSGDAVHLQVEVEQLRDRINVLEAPPIAAVNNANSSQNSSSDQPNGEHKAP